MYCVKYDIQILIGKSNKLWLQKSNYEAFVVEGGNIEESPVLNENTELGKTATWKKFSWHNQAITGYSKEMIIKIPFVTNLHYEFNIWLQRYLLKNITDRDWIRKRLFSLINSRVGTNVNSLNVDAQDSVEKSATAALGVLLRKCLDCEASSNRCKATGWSFQGLLAGYK